jgi:hypothetical protein
MRLVRIAKGRWEILAPIEPGGEFQGIDSRAARDFLSICLRVYLPLEGPPPSNLPHFQPFGDGIFELRHQGQGLGVLFRDDESRRIVYASAKAEIQTALLSKERYFQAKSGQGLEILEAGMTPERV